MNTIIILIFLTQNMFTINIQSVLGKEINEASFMGVLENDLDANIYLASNPKIRFLENHIEQIVISTNDKKRIEQVLIISLEPIDLSFYQVISREYGSDYDVMVVDNTKPDASSLVETTEDSFKETLRYTSVLLKKGDLEDSPINSVVWNEDKFRIILFFNYPKNRMEVHFMNKINN